VPAVSKIRLWNRSGAIPAAADTVAGGAATVLKTYTLATWLARGTVYTDSSVSATLLASDTASGFNTQITWSDSTETPLNPLNGCMVTMHSTVQPPNGLTLAAAYSPNDTVKFTIANVQSINAAVSDSVLLWFGLGADSTPNFTSSQNVERWPLGHVDTAGLATFSFVLPDTIFNTYTTNLYAAVVIKGINNVLSNPSVTQTQVGRPVPNNPVILQAHALYATAIQVIDSGVVPSDSIDEIRIFYQKGNPIPLVNQFVGLDSLVYAPPRNTDTAYIHIQPNTRYYFGAQVHIKGGLWSSVTQLSSANDSTPSTCKTCVNNITNVAVYNGTSAYFDTVSNRLIFNWSVDTTGSGANLNMQQLVLGVSCVRYNAAQVAAGQANPGMQADSTIFQRINLTGVPGQYGILGIDTISLGTGLVFDTAYNLYLWLKRDTDQTWALPTTFSSGQIWTGNFFRQQVNYSFESVAGGDTTYWVNRKIRFYVPPSTQTSNYTAILQNYPLDSAHSAGFINVGQPFFFNSWQASAPFNIGMQYHFPDSLAAIASKYSIGDARIYRFDSLYGRWQVQRSTVDDSSRYASIDTSDLNAPFALMIDTMPPKVVVHGGGMLTTTNDGSIYDTLTVTDNVGNLTWQFECRAGNSTFTLGDSGNQRGSTNIGSFTTPIFITRKDLLGSSSGLQALFQVNDGRNTTVQDLSPAVVLNPCATISTGALQWRPALIAGVRDSFSSQHLFGFVDSAKPTYDIDKIRLFQYSGADWEEYGSKDSSAFEFKAGRLFWVKTLNPVTFQFGTGTTLPLSDTMTIPLHANGWTDFMLPFNFDMKIGDILATSLDSTTTVTTLDALQFYSWNQNGPSGNYTCQVLDTAGIDSVINPADTLHAGSAGFTVYNPANRAVVLRIPPISAAVSSFASGVSKQSAQTGWALEVVPKTTSGIALNPVYCGLIPSTAPKASFYPVPPSLEDVGVAVCDDQAGTMHGRKMAHALNNGGVSYLLNFTNNTKTGQTVGYHLKTIGNFSPLLKTALFDPVTGVVATPGTSDITVPLDGQTSSYRMLLVGSEAYISSQVQLFLSARLGFDKIYPNPVRGIVHLCYSVPLAQIGSVGFRIFDLTGRVIWSKSIVQQSMDIGARECLWDGTGTNGRRVAPGIYIAQLTGYGFKGNKLNSYERKLIVQP